MKNIWQTQHPINTHIRAPALVKQAANLAVAGLYIATSVKVSQEAVQFCSHLRGTSRSMKGGEEEEAPIKEKYTSWALLSNDPLIHASKSFIFQRNTAGWRPREGKKCFSVSLCVCLVTTHDSFHPSNGPVALVQSINKDLQKPLRSRFLNLSF